MHLTKKLLINLPIIRSFILVINLIHLSDIVDNDTLDWYTTNKIMIHSFIMLIHLIDIPLIHSTDILWIHLADLFPIHLIELIYFTIIHLDYKSELKKKTLELFFFATTIPPPTLLFRINTLPYHLSLATTPPLHCLPSSTTTRQIA